MILFCFEKLAKNHDFTSLMRNRRNNKSNSNSNRNRPQEQNKFQFSFRRLTRHYLFKIVLSALVLNFIIFVAQFFIKTSQKLLFAGFIVLVITIIILTFLISKQQNSKKYKARTAIFSIILILVFSWSFHKFIYPDTPNQLIPCDNPKTLHDYFECDFVNATTLTIHRNVKFTDTLKHTQFHVKTDIQLNMDFISLTYFFKFYIYENDNILNFCSQIPNLCGQIMNDSLLQIYAIPEKNSNNIKTLRDLTFSRRVYIYHESYLAPFYTNMIDSLLRTEKINPEFRGQMWTNSHPHAQNYTNQADTFMHMEINK